MKLKCELKNIRMKEHMIDSKSEFSRMLNVPERTYANWEKEFSYPDLCKAFEVAQKLNKQITDIWHP